MPTRSSFVEPGDRTAVGDEVVFHGNRGNLVRVIVADRAVRAPLEQDQRVNFIAVGHPLLDQTGPPQRSSCGAIDLTARSSPRS
jgi:hypothetical protein